MPHTFLTQVTNLGNTRLLHFQSTLTRTSRRLISSSCRLYETAYSNTILMTSRGMREKYAWLSYFIIEKSCIQNEVASQRSVLKLAVPIIECSTIFLQSPPLRSLIQPPHNVISPEPRGADQADKCSPKISLAEALTSTHNENDRQ